MVASSAPVPFSQQQTLIQPEVIQTVSPAFATTAPRVPQQSPQSEVAVMEQLRKLEDLTSKLSAREKLLEEKMSEYSLLIENLKSAGSQPTKTSEWAIKVRDENSFPAVNAPATHTVEETTSNRRMQDYRR